MRRRSLFVLAVFALLAGCGGVRAVPDAGRDGGADALDEGWTKCSAPGGISVCNGPNACQCTLGGDCADSLFPGQLATCGATGYGEACAGGGGRDGKLCATPAPSSVLTFFEADENLGRLFLSSGAVDRVKYADLSAYDGTPLVTESVCPDLGPYPACGTLCGECSNGLRCVGRSPRHPTSVCLPNTKYCDADSTATKSGCDAPGDACFAFTVDGPSQRLADHAGSCIPKADCEVLAKRLPGGGHCL